MSHGRLPIRVAGLLGLLLGLWVAAYAQPPAGAPPGGKKAAGKDSDFEQVERLLTVRREYQMVLEGLRAHYIATGDVERARWAEEELVNFHRIPKYAFRLPLDIPPPTLQGNYNVPEANELYRRAMLFKDKGGWGNDYIDNQRRAELLFQQMLTNYPQSDKISDAAYQLGDIYESKAYRQYDRAAGYFERCFQWNAKTHFDARLRAAQLYDRYLNERNRAIEIYKEITVRETDAKRIEVAQKRLTALGSKK
jgi:hypothetical protein